MLAMMKPRCPNPYCDSCALSVCMHAGFQFVDDAMHHKQIADFTSAYMDEVCDR